MPSGLAAFAPACEEVRGVPSQGRGRNVSAPRGFRSAEGVRAAWPMASGPFGAAPSPIRGSAAQRAGLRYERKALAHLAAELPGFSASPWFQYECDAAEGRRWCQPDGLLPDPLILFEVKIRSTSRAWWQLSQLYRPVVEKVFGRKVEGLVMVCRSFDPAEPFPVEVRHLEALSALAGEGLAVYSWRL